MGTIDKNTKPDYKRIYQDILDEKHPDKKEECAALLKKEEISLLDIIRLNETIFGTANEKNEAFNQQHRSYDRQSILKCWIIRKKTS